MKRAIRLTLCAASACMIWGNINELGPSLMASLLFFIANVMALGYNEFPKVRNVRDLQKEMIKVWNKKA